MELLIQLPWTIKAGWIAVLLWVVAQLVGYRLLRGVPAPPPPRMSDSSRRPSAVRKAAPATALPTGGSPEFLAELGLHDPGAASSDSVYR